MHPTFDTVSLHEIVTQHADALRRRADAHARLPRAARRQRAEPGRARQWLADVLLHLAEHLAPTRLETRPAAR
jgi:hypothetical protein